MTTASAEAFSVVVTGVARAGQVGEAVAAAFARDGASVSIVARKAEDAAERARALRELGYVVHPFACDLTRPEAIAEVARGVAAATGRVDALINVAGGFAMSGPVGESDPTILAAQLSINLSTAYHATRAFLPALRASRGSVVFFSSASALPGARVREMSAYAVAKAGVITLMRSVAQEERSSGVRSNAVAPTAIRTATNMESMSPDAKYVERESVAAVVRFLCSSAAMNVTGQVFELAP